MAYLLSHSLELTSILNIYTRENVKYLLSQSRFLYKIIIALSSNNESRRNRKLAIIHLGKRCSFPSSNRNIFITKLGKPFHPRTLITHVTTKHIELINIT